MNVRVLNIAAAEARDAVLWYDDQQAGLADRFLDEYSASLGRIESFPDSFSKYEFNQTSHEIRRAILKSFPYAVIYQIVDPESIVVIAVAHLSRKPAYWIDRATDR